MKQEEIIWSKNKPVYLGASILEMNKKVIEIVIEFWYDCFKSKYW